MHLLELVLTAENQLCSTTQDFTVDGLEECKSAAIMIQNQAVDALFIKKENAADWPKGCYMDTEEDGVYFNLHSTGSSNPSARQMCKTRRKNFPTFFSIAI